MTNPKDRSHRERDCNYYLLARYRRKWYFLRNRCATIQYAVVNNETGKENRKKTEYKKSSTLIHIIKAAERSRAKISEPLP